MLALLLVGLLRGLFWVAVAEVWNPVDETAHFGYVESLATGHGIPVVGKDLVSAEVLRVAKTSPTYFFLTRPHSPSPSDEGWGGTRHQYEGVQGPIYYMLMVPAYWVSRPFGFLPAVYGVRLASVLLALVALPLTYVLARELLPRRPAVWIAAPAFLVLAQGFNANVASVSNEALAIVAPIASLIFVVRGLRDPRPGNAVAAGLLLGLAVANKTTALSLVPVIGLAWLIAVGRNRTEVASRLRWAVTGGAAALAAVAPWIAFNLYTYGALSAAEPVRAITGQYQGVAPFSLSGLRTQWTTARTAFWEFQPASPGAASYRDFWWVFVGGSVAVGVLAGPLRRRWSDWRAVAWSGSSVPLAFGVMLGIVYGVTSGEGLLVGRTLYPVLALVLIGATGAWFMLLHPRLAFAGLALVAAALLIQEAEVTRDYVRRVYLAGIVDNQVPVVEQVWADEVRPAGELVIDVSCPATTLALGLSAEVPSVAVADSAGEVSAALLRREGELVLYSLPRPVSGALRVRAGEAVGILAARDDRKAETAFAGRSGDPVARVYCTVADPQSFRFRQRFAPFHADFLSYGGILAWVSAIGVLGRGFILVGIALAIIALWRWIDVRPGGSSRTDS